MILDAAVRRSLDRAWNCKLVTIGRKTGMPRRVTIWFAFDGDEVVLTGGIDGPQWYRNIRASEDVELRIGRYCLAGRARAIEDGPDIEVVRQCFVRRYLAARLSRPFGGYTNSVAVRVAIDRCESASTR